MQVTVGRAGDAMIVSVLESRLDAAVAISFKDMIRDVSAAETGPVILDLAKVEFLDSSGLGAIVGVMKMLGTDRPLEIAALTPNVRKLFRLTRMDTVFKIHDRTPQIENISAAE